MLYLTPIIPLTFLIIAIILRRWRTGVVFIFIWLLLEDIVRRLVPAQPAYIMLIKDGLIFLTYCSFFVYIALKNRRIWQPSFVIPLVLFAGLILLGVFNFQSPNLFFGLVGLRSYLWYLPLIFLGYYMFPDKEKLLRFCRILTYSAIFLLIFAVFQYLFFDVDFILVKPLTATHQYHHFGSINIPLLSSVFGSGHRYARFLMLLFFAGLSLLTVIKGRRLFLSLAIATAFLGIVFSGSRSAFVLTIIGTALFFLFTTYTKNQQVHHLWRSRQIKNLAIISTILLALIIILFIRDFGLFQISAFYYAFQERIPWMFKEFIRAFSETSIFGTGTGTMSQGIDYIPGGAEWIEYQTKILRAGFWFETGIGKILFELGIVGFILFYLFWGFLFYRAKKIINQLKFSPLRNLGVAILIFSFLMLIWFSFLHHQAFGDATTLVVMWFFIGVLFNLRGLQNNL